MNKNTRSSDEIQAVHLPKNARERYSIGPVRFKGVEGIDVRVEYLDDDDQYKPSRKGLFVRRGKWPAFRAALDELEERLELAGLLDGVEEGAAE